MSKAVIEVMKKRMSLEERKRLCEIMTNSYTIELLRYIIANNMTLHDLLDGGFCRFATYEGSAYWQEIYSRFTPEELSYTINVKEL